MYDNTIEAILEVKFTPYQRTIYKNYIISFYSKERIKKYNKVVDMCITISTMKDSLKASRWIGYVLRMVEDLEFWDNKESRRLIKIDIEKECIK